MDPYSEEPLYGFGHNMIPIWGIIYFPIVFGTSKNYISLTIKFYMVSSSSSYIMILGKPTLTKLRVITSTIHLRLNFPIPGGIGEIQGDREMDVMVKL